MQQKIFCSVMKLSWEKVILPLYTIMKFTLKWSKKIARRNEILSQIKKFHEN